MPERRFGPYLLERELGAGGMGVVYRATKPPLPRALALKVMLPDLRADAVSRERFLREARMAAAVSHPDLVRIFDAGVEDDQLYMAMELVEGTSLAERLERTPVLAWPLALEIAGRVAGALAALHAAGIVHRDLKPGNILLGDGDAIKLVDLGLARAEGLSPLTATGMFVGSLRYASPEVLMGEVAGPATDVWSLGAVIYQMATGSLLARGEDAAEIMDAIVNRDIPRLAHAAPGTPPAVSELVARMLERDATRRPAAAEVHRLLQQGPASAPPPAASLPSAKAKRAHDRLPLRLAGVALLIGGGLGLAAVPFWMRPRAPREPREPPASPASVAGPPAPVASPSPPSSPANAAARSAMWARGNEQYARLKAGGDAAMRAVVELRRATGMDLGTDPSVWARWLEIDRWLTAGGAGEPPLTSARGRGLVEQAETRLLLKDTGRIRAGPAPEQVRTVIVAVLAQPREGALWLALGRVLALEGRAREARIALRFGLEHTLPGRLEFLPRVAWAGLADALRLVPGRDLVGEWPAWVRGRHGSAAAWTGLQDAVADADPSLFERTLRAAAANPDDEGLAALELGRYLMHRGDAARALSVWNDALARAPAAAELAAEIVDAYLARGDLAAARALAAKGRLDSATRELIARVDASGSPPPPPASPGRPLAIRLLDLIEKGDAKAASAELGNDAPSAIRRKETRLAVLLELYLAGEDARLAEAIPLYTEGSWEAWSLMADALGDARADPARREALERAASAAIADPRQAIARGVWRCRRGQFDEAARLLATPPPNVHRYLAWLAVELSLGQAWAGRGTVPPAAVVNAVRKDRVARDLIAALAEGRHADAARAAWTAFCSGHDESTWLIAVARLAALAPPGTVPAEWVEGVRVAARHRPCGLWVRRALAEAAQRHR